MSENPNQYPPQPEQPVVPAAEPEATAVTPAVSGEAPPGSYQSPYAAPASSAAPAPGTPASPAPAAPPAPVSGTPAYGTSGYGAPGYGTPASGAPSSSAAPAGTSSYGAAPAGAPTSGQPMTAPPAWAASQPTQHTPQSHAAWQRPAEGDQAAQAGYAVGAVPQPTYQAWTPPQGTSAPAKGMSGTAKFITGGVAAVVLALCSGVTGAVVATQFIHTDSNGNTGISLPNSTSGAAPVVDRSSLAGVAQKVSPSVVSIQTGSAEGSGVVLTKDGYILTNNHVAETAKGDTVTVVLSTGKKISAKIVGTDPRTDLAVIKADATNLTPAQLGNSDSLNVGDTVLAIGSPLGLQGSVTSGIISAKDRTISVGSDSGRSGSGSLAGLLQTDAPINPGNSGGALVNMNGEVIGINTAIATNGGSEGNIGVGFAIPSNKAKIVAEQLMNGKKVSHPYLGVQVTAAEAGGAEIGSVTANSPAAQAGLQEGDVVTKFGNRTINDSEDLVTAVQSGTVGQQVTIEFTRNGETHTATITLAEAS